MRFVVSIQERDAAGPGSFQGDFQVSATTEETAKEIALEQAHSAWDKLGAGPLAVWEIREEPEVVRS